MLYSFFFRVINFSCTFLKITLIIACFSLSFYTCLILFNSKQYKNGQPAQMPETPRMQQRSRALLEQIHPDNHRRSCIDNGVLVRQPATPSTLKTHFRISLLVLQP